MLAATEEELRELITLAGRFDDDSFVITWLTGWAHGRNSQIADSPRYGSPLGPATAQRVISYLRQTARQH